MTKDEEIGRNIATLRGARPQVWLAAQMVQRGCASWTQATVSAVERGTQALRAREVLPLAQALNPGLSTEPVIAAILGCTTGPQDSSIAAGIDSVVTRTIAELETVRHNLQTLLTLDSF